ncbi:MULTISPECIES: hypothetical protein [Shewanella]|jgi:hypothetical protein|uniref:Flagellar protein FliT n=2 Tax=Shewanella putrefaciens TaxID=24 RepID=A4YB29_SHEPC|nr:MULTISPECIES: hypothetical protein [Shewanella]CAD6364428.1 hypothetical protein SHEWT2_02121 [Shewanella hafniensis]ABM23338.1 conserved hypothetical protein [Shewanella sp. W3-18-1]AVV85057.1 hypothetical protein SPWS13_3328 [Shewanella putrefaciens]MCA1899011.1 hypothetical protein [Shewanella putrefaciens]MCK7635475.1 hypothetical protein [Shewanella sp. JNE17]
MSEKGGQISIKQWARFGHALRQYADAQDWTNVQKVNIALIKALQQAGEARDTEQKLAREALKRVHAQVLQELILARDELAVEMSRFREQQSGLAAYQLTQVSGALDDL